MTDFDDILNRRQRIRLEIKAFTALPQLEAAANYN